MFTFIRDGFERAGVIFTPEDCQQLKHDVLATRDFRAIFLEEAEYRRNPQRRGILPRPGRNLMARMDPRFIFFNEAFREIVSRVTGPRGRILDYAIVAAIPRHYLPDWVQAELTDAPNANLGQFIREEFRDVINFTGIDFHQDIIDFPYRELDFVTMYIYCDDVGRNNAPVIVVPGSHKLGVTRFPHNIATLGGRRIRYGNEQESVEYECVEVTGTAGSMSFWHSAILHGTQPQTVDHPRISCRILVQKNPQDPAACELADVNSTIRGPLSLPDLRRDIANSGELILRRNIINALAL
jgi:hypothetical protein